MSNNAEHIAEFARNEMVRANHTISHANDVRKSRFAGYFFEVTHMGKTFQVYVWESESIE